MLCTTKLECEQAGIEGSFALIRLVDQRVVIDMQAVLASHVQDYPVHVLAHEIGHHMLAPANLNDHGRCLARVRYSLPTFENHAARISNLYTDLLINDHLFRNAGLSMVRIYQQIRRNNATAPVSQIWWLYMRAYEILWSQQRGTLSDPNDRPTGDASASIEADAHLVARLVRVYGRDWLDGSGRFAAICLPYLEQDAKALEQQSAIWGDTKRAGDGGMPDGLTAIDPEELTGASHPVNDPRINPDARPPDASAKKNAAAAGQHREPWQYGELLNGMGIKLSEDEVAARYYRERAIPHLVKFPVQLRPRSTDPQPEGTEPWDIGRPIDEADWIESLSISPVVIPGLTTVSRSYGESEGAQPKREPLFLDLYVDSSGSMPDPRRQISYLTLAGAILALSALRAGACVQATLWSGTRQFIKTNGFVRDEHEILKILCGFFGGSTAFPLHVLRDTFANRKPSAPTTHIMVISDDGADTMLANDEQGNPGLQVCASAIEAARGGGSLVLLIGKDVPAKLHEPEKPSNSKWVREMRPLVKQGWQVHAVSSWETLVTFARAFSQTNYG